jgi:hypothetical protein
MNFIQTTLRIANGDSLAVKNVSQKTSSSAETSNEKDILGNGNVVRIKGNFIGMLNNGVLTCDRKLSGKFRNMDGWGLSRQLIFELVQTHARQIVFNIEDDGQTAYILQVTPENWLHKGTPYRNPKLDEDQLVLPESLWDKKIKASVRNL